MNERVSLILSRLKGVQNRIFLMRTALGALIFLSSILFVLILTALSSRLGHGSVLLGFVFWALSLIGLVGLMILIRKSWLNLEQTALVCERRFPELNDGLISLVQLSRMLLENRADFSLAMFERHLSQVEDKLNRLRLEDASDLKRLRMPGVICSVLFVIWLTFIFFLPGFPSAMSQSVFLKGLSREKGKELLKVSKPLELYDLEIDYIFPAYTGLESKHIEGADGNISVLAGSEVEIRAKSSIDAKSAWVQVLPQGRLEAVVKNKELGARMVIRQSGQYRFEAEDKNGLVWSEPAFHKINAIVDQVPEVELVEPDRDMVVNEEQEVVLRFHCKDDYGLESVSLVFMSREKEHRIPLKEFKPAELESELEYKWDLLSENFLPGEKIAYYIEAKDNNNVTGPGIGRSVTRYLEIFSPLKEHERLIEKEQELFEKLISFLGESLSEDVAKRDAVKYWDMEAELIRQFKDVRDFLVSLKKDVDKDDYSPMLVKEMMEQGLERYRKLIQEREESRRIRNQAWTVRLRADTVLRMEQDILFWDKQLQKQRMDFLLSLAERLKAGQKALSEMMKEYERTKDPALLKEIEAKLDELKILYQEFLARMGEIGQTLPDEFVNMDAMEKIGAGEVMSKLEKFRQAVHDRDIENALENAEDFMSALEQMLGQLEEGSDKMGSGISSENMMALRDGLKKIQELVAEQGRLIQETDAIYQKQMLAMEKAAKMAEREKGLLQSELDALSELLERQRDALNQMTPRSKLDAKDIQEFYQNRNQISNQLWQMLRELELAKKELSQDKFDSTVQRLGNFEKQMSQIKQNFQKLSQASPDQQNSREFESSCNSGINRASSARRGANKLAGQMKDTLSESDSARLDALADKQGEIEGKLNGLMKDLGELLAKLPVQPKKTMEQLGKAGIKMKDAQGELKLKNADLGLVAEKESKYWLEQAQDSLEQFLEKMKGRPKPSGMPMSAQMRSGGNPGQQGQDGRTGVRTENFKIPGPDENKDPVEMRKKILKAMREESPKEYEDLNRDYYKRLVQ